MNNAKNVLGMVAVGVALSGAALAADTSASITTRQTPDLSGIWPTSSYVHAVATAAAQSAGSMTVDVLDPKSKVPTSKIVGCQTTAENVSGTAKLLTATRSGLTVTISAGVSDTIRTSDTIRIQCTLKP
jgi:hypothetical protein